MGRIRLTGRDVEDLLAGRRPVARAEAEDDTGDLSELAALVAVLHASRELEPAPPMSPELRDEIDGGVPGIRRRASGAGYRRPVASLAAALVLLVGIVLALSRPGADPPSGDPTTGVGSPSGAGLRPPDPAKRQASSARGGSEIVPAPPTTSRPGPSPTAPPGSALPPTSAPPAGAAGPAAPGADDRTTAIGGNNPDGDRDGDADGWGGGAGTGPQTGPVGGPGEPSPRPPDEPFVGPGDEGTTTTAPGTGSSTTSSTSTTTPATSAPPTSVAPRGDGETVTTPSTSPTGRRGDGSRDDDGWDHDRWDDDGRDGGSWYGGWEWFFGRR